MSYVTGKKRGWKREDMVALQDKKDKRSCGFRGTDELYTNDQLWTLLKKYDLQKALMSASIGKSDDRKSDGPAGEQMLKKEGLVAGHAYSLIQAREVQGFKLLQLRAYIFCKITLIALGFLFRTSHFMSLFAIILLSTYRQSLGNVRPSCPSTALPSCHMTLHHASLSSFFFL